MDLSQKPSLLEEKIRLIEDFSKVLPLECCRDKTYDYIFSQEYIETEQKTAKALIVCRDILSYKKALPTKQSRANRMHDEPASANYKKELELIKDCETLMEKIYLLKNELERFKEFANNRIMELRTYVPEQYAGIGSVSMTTHFLVATSNMGPCVGVAFYCAELHRGMVVHLDSDQNNPEHLFAYLNKLFAVVTNKENKKIIATIVLSSSPHYGLEVTVSNSLLKLKEELKNKGIDVAIHTINTSHTPASLILNLQTGDIATQYKDKKIDPSQSRTLALNAPPDFMLCHLRDGLVYVQDMSSPYSAMTGDLMKPKDKEELMAVDQQLVMQSAAATTIPTVTAAQGVLSSRLSDAFAVTEAYARLATLSTVVTSSTAAPTAQEFLGSGSMFIREKGVGYPINPATLPPPVLVTSPASSVRIASPTATPNPLSTVASKTNGPNL